VQAEADIKMEDRKDPYEEETDLILNRAASIPSTSAAADSIFYIPYQQPPLVAEQKDRKRTRCA
jgi:hypothetical protein